MQYENFFSEFNKKCDDYAKYMLESSPEEYNKINDFRREYSYELAEGAFSNKLECPAKVAKKFFGEITDESIEKAFTNIDLTESKYSANLLGIEDVELYMSNNCRFFNAYPFNQLSLSIIANIFITAGLKKENFFSIVRLYDDSQIKCLNQIWEQAELIPKGTICNLCCSERFNNRCC